MNLHIYVSSDRKQVKANEKEASADRTLKCQLKNRLLANQEINTIGVSLCWVRGLSSFLSRIESNKPKKTA